MNILLTGGAGYIGSVTAKELLNRNHALTLIDDLSEGHREAIDSRAHFIEGNLSDSKVLKTAFQNKSYDAVIHFAASCRVGESVENPALYYRNNVEASLCLLEAVRENKVPKFIFSSSCAIYGEPKDVPITEQTLEKPSHPYGETKWVFENMLRWYSKAYGITTIALRYFNAAGATEELGEYHSPETHLIPNVLRAASGQLPHVEIYGTDYPTSDGTCVRDYIHILDIAEAHILALKSDTSNAFNLGNGNGYSVREVIQAAEKICKKKIPVRSSPRRAGDPPSLIASAKKIQKELGWAPKFPDLETIITSSWNWMQKNPNGFKSIQSASKRSA